MQQRALFASAELPEGFVLRDDFITPREEDELVDTFRSLGFAEAQYLEYRARRRIVSFGGRYDFSHRELHAAEPLPAWLHPLRARIAALMRVPAESIHHALVAEYRLGTPLGWHRDVPEFDEIGGVSLLGRARMRLRPYPHRKGDRAALTLDLPPRSAYAMSGPARWQWQHAISPTKELRYSVTFRTLSSSSRSDRPRDSRS
jgi:alkylated DNA repair dioxygenase AlkB